MPQRLIGLTGPSGFTPECIDMLEEFYEADFMMLYHNNADNLIRWVDRCDGICLAGGVDIHPMVYDDSIRNRQGFSKFDLKRDLREIKIIDRCMETKKPLLGICRGHQLIGVTRGFSHPGPGRQFRLPPAGAAADHAATVRADAQRLACRPARVFQCLRQS